MHGAADSSVNEKHFSGDVGRSSVESEARRAPGKKLRSCEKWKSET